MKSMAMIVRDDGYDRLLTPLTFAYVQAKKGVRVDILFTLWAVRALSENHVDSLRISGTHEAEEAWLRERAASVGPSEIRDFLGMLRETGLVSLNACAIAAAVLGVTERDLIPAAHGIIHPTRFLEEKALPADHCSYF